ncbi:MAG: hypothetical protein ACRDIB_14680 [Ardenticatenaceae bacterium]
MARNPLLRGASDIPRDRLTTGIKAHLEISGVMRSRVQISQQALGDTLVLFKDFPPRYLQWVRIQQAVQEGERHDAELWTCSVQMGSSVYNLLRGPGYAPPRAAALFF